MSLSEIKSMTEYLVRYGRVLGKRAADSLRPLHTPGSDPDPRFDDIVEFNPEREPFEPQKHVIEAAAKMLDRQGGGFIVGEMGCIAGESMVYDPVARVHRRVDEITEPFHVVSWHNGKPVVGRAEVPFIKGARRLYRVFLSNGRSFVATSNHRIMVNEVPTGLRWLFVSDVVARLQKSQRVLLPSTEEPCPSASQQGALRWSETPGDSQDHCPTDRRSCDEPLLPVGVSVRASSLQQDDALGHSHASPHQGDPAFGQGYSHPCPASDRPTTTRSAPLAGCTSHEGASGRRASSKPCGPGECLGLDDPRSLEASSPLQDTLTSSGPPASQSCCEAPREAAAPFVNKSVYITDILYERTDIYYDFTVPGFANYVMDGVVHHNTGKTIIGMLAINKYHQMKGRSSYRAAVLCPDHLIKKWAREISETIPRARVRTFDGWQDFLSLLELRSSANGKNGKSLWRKPIGPEWYIIGRNQAKWAPTWSGICERPPGLSLKAGPSVGRLSSRSFVVARELVTDERGLGVYDKTGRPVKKPVIATTIVCPSCGARAIDKEGKPIPAEDIIKKRVFCQGVYLKEVHPDAGKNTDKVDGSHKCIRLYHRGSNPTDCDPSLRHADVTWERGKEVSHKPSAEAAKRTFVVEECGEPLWQWTRKPYRWPPAKFIQKKMRGFFDDLIVDEVHEQKSEDSAQANAAGSLMGASKRVLCLTGTLIGGYASDIFALMVRMGFTSIFDEGFKWRRSDSFAEQYGSVDRIVTTTVSGASGPKTTGRRGQVSMRKESSDPKTTFREAPGIMPQLFGSHMIGRSLFITLEEMADELPPMIEYVSGSRRPDPPPKEAIDSASARLDRLVSANVDRNSQEFKDAASEHSELIHQKLYSDNWFQVGCDMDDDQDLEYKRVHGALEDAAKDLLKFGSMKLLSTFLHTTLAYPDMPYDWRHSFEVLAAVERAVKQGVEIDMSLVDTVGYWGDNKVDIGQWNGVVTPADLSKDVIRPKERALIDICNHHKALGNQCWVYCQMTDKRDVRQRLKKILEQAGLRVLLLDPAKVKPVDREAWIKQHGKNYDVMISHPKPVSTGLDLFDKGGSHNFNVLIFYQTGYSLFDTRQASRRSWRIGQDKPCFVYYLYYRGTMQHRAMQLQSRKMAAAMAVDGEFSAEGLAGLADGDGGAMSLVKSLSDNMSDEDMQRGWGKVRGGMTFREKADKPCSVFVDPIVVDDLWEDDDVTPRPGLPSPLDRLSDGAQLVAEALLDGDAEFFDEDVQDEVATQKSLPAPANEPKAEPMSARERMAWLLANFDEFLDN